MVWSKCGRLLVAAGLPAAAAGLTLAAGCTASAATVASPVVHVVEITADVPCDGHPAIHHVGMPERFPTLPVTRAAEPNRPATAPVAIAVRPAACSQAHTPEQTRPVVAPVPLRPVDMPERFPIHVVAHTPEQTRPVDTPAAGKADKVQPVRPEHPVVLHPVVVHPVVVHAPAGPLEAERHEGFKVQGMHQTVTLKIETTAFTITGQQGSERSS